MVPDIFLQHESEKAKKPKSNISKVLATLAWRSVISFLSIRFFLYYTRRERACLMTIFVVQLVLFLMVCWKVNYSWSFYRKLIFLDEAKYFWLFSLLDRFITIKNICLITFFLLKFHASIYLDPKNAKNSLVHACFLEIVANTFVNWRLLRMAQFSKNVLFQTFIKKSRIDQEKHSKLIYQSSFRCATFWLITYSILTNMAQSN